MQYSILVVDDKPENIALIMEYLGEMGITKSVYSAPNGKIASELALKYSPDLILTDWDMPEMTGLELVKFIKGDEATQHIPIIMITAVMTEPKRLQQAFDSGVHDFLSKPYSKLEFFSRVGNAMKLDQAYKEVNLAKLRLEELNQLKDKLFSIISHDIKSPLANLHSILMMIDQGIMTKEEASEYYQAIDSNVVSVITLLENLLEWSQWQLRKGVVPKEVDIRQETEAIFSLVKNQATKKNIDLVNDVPDEQVVKLDKDMLAFVIRNLVTNAMKFTSNGSVSVNSVLDDNSIHLNVVDTGIGMDETKLASLFKGQRVDSEKGTLMEPGTGVGLTLCQEFVESNGGKISVTSEVGKGSIFKVFLPLSEN
ncbi:hybrid sensor histidine kinase/response regulator [Fulvivirga sp. RKSG066]|uniref:hybrid sensor histidine kinase/response regulator n=1 Tax=Fulvivirga aurantia TaxID=2529383 RepID=UPI0012BC6213|nr:hybrid sensor histidine kinase/response regulator [Fulvivirga aurantia]MTI21963.1 hybrid sensor histidine kinase/response regulator [Fulvivirga aurantia]